jgi:DNA-directed RNA polymerase specialized sigma24 family protein
VATVRTPDLLVARLEEQVRELRAALEDAAEGICRIDIEGRVLSVNRAFSRLPERCRTVLRLRYGLGYEPKEVADRLGYSRLSIGKVTNRCFKALLVAILEEQECRPPEAPADSAAAAKSKAEEGGALISLGTK